MRYGVLGPLAVWDADGRPVGVPEAKVRALLANLLVHRGGPVPADRLVEDIWAGDPPAGAAGALQTKVSQLRRVLGRDRVVREPAGYRLVLEGDEVDAFGFQELVERAGAEEEPAVRCGLLADALALWRGPAYADAAGALFALAEVARLEELRLTALEDQAEARLEVGGHAALAAELGDAVARHPLRERLRTLQMRALYRAGRQTEALAAFEELRRRLADELGVSPGPEAAGLHTAILRQEPHLAPPAGRAPCRSNLPAPLTALVGREDAVEELRARLAPGAGTRLVTLTGLGGIGKTRLAVAAAGGMTERFADGVWLVELAGLGTGSTPDDLAEQVLKALDHLSTPEPVVPPREPDAVGRLCRAVADRRPLIVLDNCEHVVEAAAELAGAVLAAAPGAHLLATGQEPLGIPGELVRPVPPLALPEPTGAVARTGAVELFVERAAAAVPGFVLDEGNARAVARICRRLDGVPLALELVAPRLRTMTPERLAAYLDDRCALLAARARGVPARQRTLRDTLDCAWELLAPDERAVLGRLSAHPGGWSPASAEAIGAGPGAPADRVPDLLSRLVDRSLLIHEAGRFRMLESVAAYCAERLAEPEVQGTR
ncbi:BTAD domain-containing putative transcriptional regulator [Actinomadura litoris]|uniref:BTAD domain-containing putative transcriptional regulator n=1 Tax=Actinomadura litoris TaxID=2678616 RepID=UPI001FA7D57C|nr:BTAD domain-containing putative transcriptional regulator [Actinomadura litoris]